MRTWVMRFLAAPVFEGDEDRTRLAALLHSLLLLIMAGSIVVGLVAPFIFADPYVSSASALRLVGVILLGLCALALASFILMKCGLVQPASVLILLGLWISLTVLMFLSDGVNSIFAMGYLTTTVIAGLLLGGRAAILMVELIVVAALGMLYAKENGVLPAPVLFSVRPPSAAIAWGFLTGNLIAVVAMLVLASRGITEVLARARRSAAALEQQREFLEEVVADRTRDLERRAVQLATAADVGRVAASILHLETLAHQVVELVRGRFHLHYVGLFLVDNTGKYAVLEAGTGETGRTMREEGHKLEVGGVSVVGAACAQRQACVAQYAGGEDGLPAVAQAAVGGGSGIDQAWKAPLLPETRSEIALPLVVGEQVLGALDLQSTSPGAFSEADTAVLQLVADQVAVAVENALKFSREADLLEATSPLFRVSRRLVSAVSTDEIVEAIVTSVAETEADGCVVGRLNRGVNGDVESVTVLRDWNRHLASRAWKGPTGATFPADAFPLPLRVVTSFWMVKDETRSSFQDQQASEALRLFLAGYGGRGFVNVPLKVAEQGIGFVSVYRAGEGSFSPVSIRLYETLADQAAVAMERARLLDEAQARAGREHVIAGVTARMRETLDVDVVLQTAVTEMAKALGLPKVEVRLGYGMAAVVPPRDGQARVATGRISASGSPSHTGTSEGE
jgi:GAF domain-containing protein